MPKLNVSLIDTFLILEAIMERFTIIHEDGLYKVYHVMNDTIVAQFTDYSEALKYIESRSGRINNE